MTTQEVTLQTLAENEHLWRYVATKKMYLLIFPGSPGRLFSVENLAEIDARLAIAVPYLFTNEVVDVAADLRRSIALWLDNRVPPLVLDNTNNNDVTIHLYVNHIRSVESRDKCTARDTALYTITGTCTYTTPVHHVAIVLLCDSPFTTGVPGAWLENHFPGVTARLQFAAGLGLTPEEQAQYGLYNHYVPAMTGAALPEDLQQTCQ